MRWLTGSLALVAGVGYCMTACGSPDSQTESLNRHERGRGLYDGHCAVCHESEVGIGPLLVPRVLASYKTAKQLFEYTRRTMPYGLANSLAEDEYWAITAFLIVDRKLTTVPGHDIASADSLLLRLEDGPG